MKIYEKYLNEKTEDDIIKFLKKEYDEDDTAVTIAWIDKTGKWNTFDWEYGAKDRYRSGKSLNDVMPGWKEKELKGLENKKLAKAFGFKQAWIIDM